MISKDSDTLIMKVWVAGPCKSPRPAKEIAEG